MVVVPIVCAAGFLMPKTSSRSISSPAGTADTVEVLARVSFTVREMQRIVRKNNGCMVWGGAMNLASADDKLIRVRHPLSLDPEGMLLASILAKKHAVSATHVLVDIPIGSGAKLGTRKEALHLKRRFESIASVLNMHITTTVTDGSQPIGNGIGPALECRDVIWLLERNEKRPLDLERKSLSMAGKIMAMSGRMGYGEARSLAKQLLETGAAAQKFWGIIESQGGKRVRAESIRVGKFTRDVCAEKSGTVAGIDNIAIAKIARIAGAPADKGTGIYLHHHAGDKVQKGERLFTIYAESKENLRYAIRVNRLSPAFRIAQRDSP
jgi:thymidine phosphorylase